MLRRINLHDIGDIENLIAQVDENPDTVLIIERETDQADLVMATNDNLIKLLGCMFTLNGLASNAGYPIVIGESRDPGPG